jgi:hypothetical protein
MVKKASVSQYIEGHFPADKQELIKRAKKTKAPEPVMEVLNNLPKKEFQDINDLWQAVIK